MRAQAPPIDEAFRKLSLACTTDGYQIISVDPARYSLETGWRDLKEKELSREDRVLSTGSVQSRVNLRLENRGKLYEIYLVPTLRYRDGDSWREIVAGVQHPLWEKWSRVLHSLIEKEAREED